MLFSLFDISLTPIPWTEWNIITITWILYSATYLQYLFLSTTWLTFCSTLLATDILSERFNSLRFDSIHNKSIHCIRPVLPQKICLRFYQLHLILFSHIIFLSLRQLSITHEKLFNVKTILKISQWKRSASIF